MECPNCNIEMYLENKLINIDYKKVFLSVPMEYYSCYNCGLDISNSKQSTDISKLLEEEFNK